MNLIIPMAGKGKRLRPHTLTTPKPLIPIAGKPIVQRLVEDIAAVIPDKVENIGFIVGDFGEETEQQLLEIARAAGAKGHIFYQDEALGTAHAVYCAKELLTGKTTIAFSDTLFRANFQLDTDQDGIIWVKQVDDPSAYGVVNLDQNGFITEFIEKPPTPISDLAIIGIYYFREGQDLRKELDQIISNKVMAGGEYQLTTALENLKMSGTGFKTETVEDWLDCGNKVITVQSNSRYLNFLEGNQIAESASVENSIVNPPVFIGENVKVRNSVIGPNVSIGSDSLVENSVIKSSLIQSNNQLNNVNLINSMIGNFVKMEATPDDVSLGDYSEWKG